MVLMVKRLLERFMKRNCKKQTKKFRIKKVLKKKKQISLISNGKAMRIYLIAGSIKNILNRISHYFPKPYEPFGGDINVKMDLFNYETKTDK